MKVSFTINVPTWLYRFRWKNVKGYLTYQLFPFRCEACNVKMPHNYFDVELNRRVPPLKATLTVGYHTLGGKALCQHCLQDRIATVAAKPDFMKMQEKDSYNVAEKCDVCEQQKTAFKAIRMSDGPIDNVRFCTRGSWNGNYVCLDCVEVALESGDAKSSIYGTYKGKFVPTNKYGLPVVDGKVRFPDK